MEKNINDFNMEELERLYRRLATEKDHAKRMQIMEEIEILNRIQNKNEHKESDEYIEYEKIKLEQEKFEHQKKQDKTNFWLKVVYIGGTCALSAAVPIGFYKCEMSGHILNGSKRALGIKMPKFSDFTTFKKL